MSVNKAYFNGPGGIVVPRLASDPATGVNGEIYYNTTSDLFKQYGGGTWAALGGSSGANTTLSNLTSPTAANQNLLPATDGSSSLGISGTAWSSLTAHTVKNSTDDFIVVDIDNRTLNDDANNVKVAFADANITLQGRASSAGTGGNILIAGGDDDDTGTGGNVTLQAGASDTGTPGSILINSAGVAINIGPDKASVTGNLDLNYSLLTETSSTSSGLIWNKILSSTTLTASTGPADTGIAIDHAAGQHAITVKYLMTEATTNAQRVGTILLVISDDASPVASISEVNVVQTAAIGVTFTAVVTGTSAMIKYTNSDAHNISMKFSMEILSI